MFILSLATASVLIATYGEDVAYGAVVKIEECKSDGVWSVEIYCGAARGRGRDGELDRKFIAFVNVDGKAKDPFTGRFLIDEMRKLLKSKELVYIWFNRREGVAKAVAVQKDTGLALKETPAVIN